MSPEIVGHIVVAMLALTLFLGAVHGYREGLIRGAFKLLGLVCAFILAKPVAELLAPYIEDLFGRELHWYVLVAISFLLIATAFTIAGILLSKFISWTPLAFLDKVGGAALGLLISIALVGLFLNLITDLDRLDPLIEATSGWEGKFLETLRALVPDLFERGESLIQPLRDKLPEELL